jgi:hypothetical protein
VAEAGRRVGAVVPGGLLQDLEVADGADVVEPVALEECEAGAVVAAVLEPLEPVQKKFLGRPLPDVSDDPAHPEAPFVAVSGVTPG